MLQETNKSKKYIITYLSLTLLNDALLCEEEKNKRERDQSDHTKMILKEQWSHKTVLIC